MRFELTPDQRAVRDEARQFAATEIAPVAAALDRDHEYPAAILAALGQRRFAGLTLSETHGGRGAGLVELALVVEELSAVMMPVASALALHLGVAEILERHGSSTLAEELLPEMARFETVGALGLTEEDAGSDVLAMETRAERDGDGWVLAGRKRWVTNFHEADVVLTYAKTGPDADAPHNVSAFLVPADAFELVRTWDTLGANSVKTCEVRLDGVAVPADRLVGEPNEGYVERGAATVGVNVPARAVGIARAALADTVDHVGEREQFGGPLADHQGVRWRLAEMARRTDAARLLTLRAADALDRGTATGHELHMAKDYATRVAVDNASDAMQLHGGIGYTTDRDVERYLRDARLLTVAGGPNERHRDAVADTVLAG